MAKYKPILVYLVSLRGSYVSRHGGYATGVTAWFEKSCHFQCLQDAKKEALKHPGAKAVKLRISAVPEPITALPKIYTRPHAHTWGHPDDCSFCLEARRENAQGCYGKR